MSPNEPNASSGMNGNTRIRAPVMPSPRRIVPVPVHYPIRPIVQKLTEQQSERKQEGSSSLDNFKRQPNDERPSPSGLINTPGLNNSFRILSSDFFLHKEASDKRDGVSRG